MHAHHMIAAVPLLAIFLTGCAMDQKKLVAELSTLDTRVLTDQESRTAPAMLADNIALRTRQANAREAQAWSAVRTVADWERFRDARLDVLCRTLGTLPDPTEQLQVAATVPGDGFRIENLVIAARPGLPIAANLYVPDPPRPSMPAILICSSHHNPKTQGELMDMGMTWARAGAMVLVIDNLGHGERRQQPFGGREDYRWRYYLGMQLYAASESLMGWMVADLRRGVDVLLSRPGVDGGRVIVIGAVAGGGDPAAVLAATDRRIACAIPFNFGSATGKAADADYVSPGDYETTRCLRRSAADGFTPWMIVAAAAPRYVVFAKEFEWSADADPAFGRIARIFDLYAARDRLDSLHGWGRGDQSAAVASHCNNVGPPHRKALYPILERWLKMPVPQEYTQRLKPDDLTCLTAEAKEKFPQRKVHELAAELAGRRLPAARLALASLPPDARLVKLREDWSRVLGGVDLTSLPTVKHRTASRLGQIAVERLLLATEPGIVIPVVLLSPADGPKTPRPTVICLAREGKAAFLARRAADVSRLLASGTAVCLADVRGVGETQCEGDRCWYGPGVELASQELMLGGTMLGARLRDARAVVRYLQSRPDLDGQRLAMWGESCAPANPPDFVDPPMKSEQSAAIAEPLAAHLALLTALYEDGVQAVIARGGLVGYASLFDGPACHIALDDIVPCVLEAGDIADVAAALAPRPLRIERALDGRNRLAPQQRLTAAFTPTERAYATDPSRLAIAPTESADTADWLTAALSAQAQAHRDQAHRGQEPSSSPPAFHDE